MFKMPILKDQFRVERLHGDLQAQYRELNSLSYVNFWLSLSYHSPWFLLTILSPAHELDLSTGNNKRLV